VFPPVEFGCSVAEPHRQPSWRTTIPADVDIVNFGFCRTGAIRKGATAIVLDLAPDLSIRFINTQVAIAGYGGIARSPNIGQGVGRVRLGPTESATGRVATNKIGAENPDAGRRSS